MEIKVPTHCIHCIFLDQCGFFCKFYRKLTSVHYPKPDFCKIKTLVDKDQIIYQVLDIIRESLYYNKTIKESDVILAVDKIERLKDE